jgi:integrase/recombinase XerC
LDVADGFLLIRRWQAFLVASGRVNESTRQQYRRALVGLIADVCKDPRDITEDDLIAWIRDRDPRGGAVAMTLRACHSFYGWAFIREEIMPNPVRAIEVPRRKYGKPPAMTGSQLVAVLGAARAYRDPRLAPMLELMYATGARIGSVCGLEARDLDFERAWIEFRVAKNDDPYGVPMNARASSACRELLDLSAYKPRNAVSRRPTLVGVGRSRAMQWIQELEESTGIPVWSHLFRHTLLTELAHDPTVPIAVTSKLANHKDPRTTMRYVADREGAMTEAMTGR